MEKGSVVALSKYRFETAENDLQTAKMLFEAGHKKPLRARGFSLGGAADGGCMRG